MRFIKLLFLIGYSFFAAANEIPRISAWQLDCEKYNNQCITEQNITVKDSSQTLLEVMVSYVKSQPAPHIIFRTSPNANLQKGAAVKIDEHPLLEIPISDCDDNLCEARSFIPKALFKQMIEGRKLHFAFFIDEKQQVYPVSLAGFKESFSKVLAKAESK